MGAWEARVDLLVIGLGPAGGSAARVAAGAGLSVLAVDKKRQIGWPVQCAEFLPLPMGAYATAPGVLQQRIGGMQSFLPSGAVHRSDFPGLMIDRACLDRAIAEAAERAGARLATHTRLIALDAAAHVATLEDADGTRQVSYRMLIAADGRTRLWQHVSDCRRWPASRRVSTRCRCCSRIRTPTSGCRTSFRAVTPGCSRRARSPISVSAPIAVSRTISRRRSTHCICDWLRRA